jgi:hypothetical protein
VRKALVISFFCHVALAIGICQWKAFQSVNDDPRQVYEVELVDGVHTENSIASVNVQPAVLTPEGPQDVTQTMPAPTPAVEQKKPERDPMAPIKIPGSQHRPEASRQSLQDGSAPTASAVKGSRFAIDAPPGETAVEPIGDIEARGSFMQPLHVTHRACIQKNYILSHSSEADVSRPRARAQHRGFGHGGTRWWIRTESRARGCPRAGGTESFSKAVPRRGAP